MTIFFTSLVLGTIIGIFCGYKQLPWYYAFCSTFIVSMILYYILGGFLMDMLKENGYIVEAIANGEYYVY